MCQRHARFCELKRFALLRTETIEDIVHGKNSRGNIERHPVARIICLRLMHRMMQRSRIDKNQTQQTDTTKLTAKFIYNASLTHTHNTKEAKQQINARGCGSVGGPVHQWHSWLSAMSGQCINGTEQGQPKQQAFRSEH